MTKKQMERLIEAIHNYGHGELKTRETWDSGAMEIINLIFNKKEQPSEKAFQGMMSAMTVYTTHRYLTDEQIEEQIKKGFGE